MINQTKKCENEDVVITETCSICLEHLKNNSKNGTYSDECGHTFHTDCIAQWWKSGNVSCPLCRSNNRNLNLTEFETRVSLFKKYARRKNGPSIVKDILQKLKTSQAEFDKAKKETQIFKKKNKDIFKEYIKLNKRCSELNNRIMGLEEELIAVPILYLPFNDTFKIMDV